MISKSDNQKKVTQKYFSITEEVVDSVRKSFGVSEVAIRRDVEILKEWIKKQPHLPQNSEDAFYEKMLLFNKFRLETAKIKIDNYFSVRSLEAKVFEDIENFRINNENNAIYLMPKRTPNNQQIIIVQINIKNQEICNIQTFLQNTFSLIELGLKYEYNVGIHIVVDLRKLTLGCVTKYNINDIIKLIRLALSIGSIKIIAVHGLSVPSFAFPMINAVKAVFKNSLFQKITVYKDNKDILKRIPEDSLPVELGGTCSSEKDLLNDFDELIKENQDYLQVIKNVRSDESKRIGQSVLNSHDFGVDGSFKKLNVD